MLSFVSNNSLLILAANKSIQQPSGINIEYTELYDSTLAIDAIYIPDKANKLYDSTLAIDTLALTPNYNNLYQSSLYLDIFCSDSF